MHTVLCGLGRTRVYASPPNGGYGWVITFATFLIYVLTVGMQYTIGIFYRTFLASGDDFLSGPDARAQLAWVVSIESAMFLGGSYPAGHLINRLGVRSTVLIGTLCLATGFLCASLSTHILSLFLSFGLIGTGTSLPMSAGVVAVQRYFTSKRATATGLAVAGSGVGGLILGPIVEAAVEAYGWRVSLRILALVTTILLPVACTLLSPITIRAAGQGQAVADKGGENMCAPSQGLDAWETEGRKLDIYKYKGSVCMQEHKVGVMAEGGGAGGSTADPPLVGAQPEASEVQIGSDLSPGIVEVHSPGVHTSSASAIAAPMPSRELLRRRPFQLWLSFVALYGCAWFVCLAHLVQFFGEAAGTSASDAARLVALQGAANTVGRIALGMLADRVSTSKVTILAGSVSCVGLATLGLSIPSLASSHSYQAVYMLANGALGGSIVSLQAPITVDLVGLPSMPLAQGLFNLVQAPFVLAGPPIAGAVRAGAGSYVQVWAFTGMMMLTSAAVCMTIERVGSSGSCISSSKLRI